MNECKNGLPSLNTLLCSLRAHNIVLKWDVSPGGRAILLASKNIPAKLRHAIWRYSPELLILHILADVRVCRNPDKHRRTWHWLGSGSRFFTCPICFHSGLWNENEQLLQHVHGERLVTMQAKEDAIEEVSV